MGHMNVIPVISKGFNFYFPMLICLLSIGTLFRLGSRCLHACGIRQFFDDDDLSGEYVEDGKALMRQGKERIFGIKRLNDKIFLFVIRTSKLWWNRYISKYNNSSTTSRSTKRIRSKIWTSISTSNGIK